MYQHLTDDELLSYVGAKEAPPTDLELELATRLAGAVDALDELVKEQDALCDELADAHNLIADLEERALGTERAGVDA